MSITLTKITEEKMKLNSIIKTASCLVLVIFALILASCSNTASNVSDSETTVDTVATTDDITIAVPDTTVPDETDVPSDTTEQPEDTEPEETTVAIETEPAREVINPVDLGDDESETPDDVITGESLKALVESADEAWGWFKVYHAFLEKDTDPVIYREKEYYPVANYKTLDELRERLLECFSVSLVNRMVSDAFNSESPLFIIENGMLLGCEHARLTDIDKLVVSDFYAKRTGERTATFVRPVQIRDTINGSASVSNAEHTYNMVFEYGRWVFDSYSDYNA